MFKTMAQCVNIRTERKAKNLF